MEPTCRAGRRGISRSMQTGVTLVSWPVDLVLPSLDVDVGQEVAEFGAWRWMGAVSP